MKFKTTLIAAAVATLSLTAVNVMAKVSTAEAEKLGNELTPFGAERAANAVGSIPEWTGGMTTAPTGYKQGGTRIDPFAAEKPIFTITAGNYKKHADKLTMGQKALFEKYSNFTMNVYKTHRTAAAPQWVYDHTKVNATRAELSSSGNSVVNAYAGIPFPIPQNGHEAIWNHNLRWLGEGSKKQFHNLTVYGNGDTTLGKGDMWEAYPYYNSEGGLDTFKGNLLHALVQYRLPVRRKGEVILARDSVNAEENPRQAWQYIPGQRRVRRAPTIAFDTPNPQFAGQGTFDDAFMFNGSPERYDWKLVGKKEVYIPYNNNGLLAASEKGEAELNKIATPYFINPEYSRWELHRVWEVEATVKENQRHVYGKRTFYLDEDSWAIAATDIFDGRNTLWRVGFATLLNAYDVPVTAVRGTWHTDLQNGIYAVNELDSTPIKFYKGEKDKFFTPGQVRKLSKR